MNACCWSGCEEIPHVQGQRRSPSKMVGEITFRIKPHTCKRCSEGSNLPCVHKDPETPQRLRQNCDWVFPAEGQVSSGLPQGQGLWVQQTWVLHKPSLEKAAINPTIEPPELTQDRGNRLLEGTNRTLCTPGPRRKEQGPHKSSPDLPVSLQEPLAEAWVRGGLLQGWGHWM